MMGLIGRKIGMTQLFSDQGEAVPVTVIEVGPCTVTELRTEARDGYMAVQLGFGTQKESRMARPFLGQFKKRNLTPSRVLREFRVDDLAGLEVGQSLKVDLFEKGTHVDVVGTTKGRGFTGVVKRYGFTGGKATHGTTTHKQPGSIGASAYPSRVIKGKRLPGRMGTERYSAKNLEVIGVDAEQNVLMVRGAVPGPTRGLVLIHKRKD
jgi:large subunit ribosomal protein L3